MIHGYRSAYQTSSPSRSRTPRTPASPARKAAAGGGGNTSRSASSSEASTPTGRQQQQQQEQQQTRPRSTTAPSNEQVGDTTESAMLPPIQQRRADEREAGREERKAGGGEQRSDEATKAAPSASSTDSSPAHSLRVSTAPLSASLSSATPLPSTVSTARTAAVATAGPLTDRLLSGAVDEQPSSARSDSVALWKCKSRTVSGADTLTGALSLSQPVSPAKVRGRSLLLQTLPAQLFSPSQPTQPPADPSAANNHYSLRSSATASPSETGSPSGTALPSSMSAAPPLLASSAPPPSAAAATLSPEKLNLSPGLTHIIQMRNKRKEADNKRRREEVELHCDEQRTALTMEELQPRLIALQAERKHAVEAVTESGAGEEQHTDTQPADSSPQSDAAAAQVTADSEGGKKAVAADDGFSLPAVLGGLLLLGMSVYGSWMWYQRQKRRAGIRR